MNDPHKINSHISTFSTILIMVVLMIVGFAMIPMLSIQYTPSIKQSNLSINVNWPGASARIIEQEVTSKLEGVISAVSGVHGISSISYQGSGVIWVTLKKEAKVDNVRFEISSVIRRVYSKLPEGVSYPWLSVSTSGTQTSPVITYTINCNAPPKEIKKYIENNLLHRLSSVQGVSEVALSGANDNYLEVMFNSDALRIYGISVGDIASAIESATGKNENVGQTQIGSKQFYVSLTSVSSTDIASVPIKKIDGRIITLSDIASLTIKEEKPSTYSRINGLNTVNISIFPDKNVNTLKLVQRIKDEMIATESVIPDKYGVIIADDSSIYIKKELNKIILRTTLAMLILLAFTFAVTRSLRYMVVIAITLTTNLLIAFIFYKLFDIELHLYSLAGITVSLGIIIDTSIIMIDHYGYYRNRKAFLAILAALLTTIGALIVVLFLPDDQKVNLTDFSAVIIINLTISMVTALLFIPALLDKIPMQQNKVRKRMKALRRVVRISHGYLRFIIFGRRFRWIFIVIAILAFGIPLYLLPEKIEIKEDPTFWQNVYNKTIGTTLYQKNIRSITDVAFGGTMRLFANSISGGNYYREPERTRLYINAGMPEGCTVHQLNDVVVAMENFLSKFPEIEIFRTNIYSYNHASIEVVFHKKYEQSGFPYFLKSAAISEAINFGGANWSIYGVGNDGFNNNLNTGYKPYQIVITGYDYDQLYRYATQLVDSLSMQRRISDPGIFGNVSWGNNLSRNELFIDFDPTQTAMTGMSPHKLFSAFSEQLYNNNIARYFDGSSSMNIRLISDMVPKFDIWQLNNHYLSTSGEANQIKFPNLAKIGKRRSGNDIYRYNQQYRLIVAYDFIGPYEMANKMTEKQCENLNDRLPMGYKASVERGWWGNGSDYKNYLLLLLIATIIYFICAILFESLHQPLVIISLIPISFIGVFLIFYITGFRFDQGGFAAFVLLSGLVVNAGIYIINEFNNLQTISFKRGLHLYLRAFNHKIIPIMLTIVSTMLGLIPFLYDGESEVFWFSFAIGTIGGMIFSIIALILYLPLFLKLSRN